MAFFGQKTPIFRQIKTQFVNRTQDKGTTIHYTTVLCCDTEYYSGYHLNIAILVNFGRLGLFWVISWKPRKILHHFLFFSAFQTPMDQENISNL